MFGFSFLKKYNIVKGILHVGAHLCEEEEDYLKLGLTQEKILWVDANYTLCLENKKVNPARNIFCGVFADKAGEEREFIITDNSQSNSLLELEEHKVEHPWVHEVSRQKVITSCIDDSFLSEVKTRGINMIVMDIQGAELLALKGAEKTLEYIDIIHCEVNIKKLYKDCALIEDIDDFLFPKGYKRIATEINEHGWGEALYLKFI
jgi:FkbM family methyltransferase